MCQQHWLIPVLSDRARRTLMDDLERVMDDESYVNIVGYFYRDWPGRVSKPQRLRLNSDSDFPDRWVVRSNRANVVMIGLKHYAALTVAIKKLISRIRRKVINRLNKRLRPDEWLQTLNERSRVRLGGNWVTIRPWWEREHHNMWDNRRKITTNRASVTQRRSPDTLPF